MGSSASAKCAACEQLYKAAEYLVTNKIVRGVAQLGTSLLCSVAGSAFAGPIGGSASGVTCAALARRVLNYARKNGFSRQPNDACRSIGLCP